MDYHDNRVRFVISANHTEFAHYTLDSGSFIVTDFCVSPGQDPREHMGTGKVFPCGSDGNFSFPVGRHGTKEVADWFNEQCGRNNTFDRPADRLHFAMAGNLLLKVSVGRNLQVDCIFKSIVLAQGHTGASDSWWLGAAYPAKRSAHVSNALWCSATIPRSRGQHDAVFMLFKRGGNGPAQVSVEEIKWSPAA
jgi:hypothetical protein